MKKINILCLKCMLVSSALIFTGCWDKVEIEDRAFVVAIGIDKAMDKDSLDELEVVTIEPSVDSLENKSSDKMSYSKIGNGKTVSLALNRIDMYSSKRQYLGHTKVAILGEKILKDPKMLSETLDGFQRNSEISNKLLILATDKNIQKILDAKIKGEPMAGLFLSNFYQNRENNSGVTFKKDLDSVLEDTQLNNTTIIPKVSLEDKDLRLGGSAIIKDYRLLGWLDNKETRGYVWVNDNAKNTELITKLDNIDTTLLVESHKKKINFKKLDNDILVANIDIDISGSIKNYALGSKNLYNQNNLSKLENLYSKIVKSEINTTFRKLQSEYNVDIFNFLKTIEKQNYDLYLEIKDNWNYYYNNMQIVPNVNVNIRNIGSVY